MAQVTEEISKKAQKCIRAAPVILIGSGASVPFNLPTMEQLADRLCKAVSTPNEEEQVLWNDVKSELSKGKNLEQALSMQELPMPVIEKIVEATWSFVCKADVKVYRELLSGTLGHPLTKLIGCYSTTSNKYINILTTNYDRVIEYALNAANVRFSTGFPSGYARTYATEKEILVDQHKKQLQTVRLLKIHGSLDWFSRKDNTNISSPQFNKIPADLKPLIVTPGIRKYETMHGEPFRSILQEADTVMQHAKAFLCIGFGFRDDHLEPKMRKVLKEQNVPIVLITKQTTKEANDFIKEFAGSDYLILEANNNNTLARSDQFPDSVCIPGNSWSLQGFMKLIT